MTTTGLASPTPSPNFDIRPLAPEPPAWVLELFAGAAAGVGVDVAGEALTVVDGTSLVRVTALIAGARALDAGALSDRVTRAYIALLVLLRRMQKHAIRIWNYVPGIVEPVGAELDRYMAFNRGRHAAFTQDSHGRFERTLPTASAIGIGGPDLVIDCLAADAAGTPLENPRQIASWRYSRRYGPRPPCFSRGTIAAIRGRRMLLLGGTASIRGEDSLHPGNLPAQIDEVLTNMDALIGAGAGETGDGLHRLTDLRVYVVNPADAGLVERALRARMRRGLRMEIAMARVCRPELLVEVEGLAELPSSGPLKT